MELKRLLRNQWDRTLAIVLALAGLVAIYLGYRGVADALVPSEQIPYLASGAVGGLFLLGAGATVWLSSDIRDEWRRIDDLIEALESSDVGNEASSSDDNPHAKPEQNGHAPQRGRRKRPLAPAGADESAS